MPNNQKILWIITVFNSIIILIFLLLALKSYFSPSYDNQLRAWVQSENKKTIDQIEKNNSDLRSWVDEQVQRLYDYGNQNWGK